MKRILPGFLFLVAFAGVLTGQVAAPVATATVAPTVGRFQLMEMSNSNNSEIWMVDTQTGDSWRRQGQRWVYMGNPTVDPGTALPQRRPAAVTQPVRPQVELP
jgi:hypothetical protein